MLIKITRGCLVPHHPEATVGSILDLPHEVASVLLAIGKAERYETREPEVEHRDPLPPVTVRRKPSAPSRPK